MNLVVISLIIIDIVLLLAGVVAIILLNTLSFGGSSSLDPGSCAGGNLPSKNLTMAMRHYDHQRYGGNVDASLLGVSKYTIINNIVLPSNYVPIDWLSISGTNTTLSNTAYFSITCTVYDIYLDEFQIGIPLTTTLSVIDKNTNTPKVISAANGASFNTVAGDHQVILMLGADGIEWTIIPSVDTSTSAASSVAAASEVVTSSLSCTLGSTTVYLVNDISITAYAVLLLVFQIKNGVSNLVQQVSITDAFNQIGYAYQSVPANMSIQVIFVMKPTSTYPFRALMNSDDVLIDGNSLFYNVCMNNIQTGLLICPSHVTASL